MGQVEALGIPGVRTARRCFLRVGGAWEDEVVVVDAGEFYAVGSARQVVYRVYRCCKTFPGGVAGRGRGRNRAEVLIKLQKWYKLE